MTSQAVEVFDRTDQPDRASGRTNRLYNGFKLTVFEDDIYSFRRMRGIIMPVFLKNVAFSLQNDRSFRRALTKVKRLVSFIPRGRLDNQSLKSRVGSVFPPASMLYIACGVVLCLIVRPPLRILVGPSRNSTTSVKSSCGLITRSSTYVS